MAKNKTLNKAKDAKNDEFYTQRSDIENELSHYADHFKDKVVYCNCDDPKESEFWQFFMRNFKAWGLKKLIATHYEPDEKNYSYVLEICEDTNGDGVVNYLDEPTVTQIPCNGDFRSGVCIEYLKEADIVVTNPPFSLFREYVAQLLEYDKKFVIIGHQNALKYKEIFPLIKDGKIWLGYGFPGNVGFFRAPHYEDYAVSSQHKEGLIRVSGVCWYTNLDIPKRHTNLDLRGNYYNPEDYPMYINFDAIDVSKVIDIPCDYDGLMGVPITFMDKYNPDQFEIIGVSNVNGLLDGVEEIGDKWVADYKAAGGKGHITSKMHSLVGYTSDGVPKSFYTRIIIRNKHPEERRYED